MLGLCPCCSMSLHGSRRHQGNLDSLKVPVKRGHRSARLYHTCSGRINETDQS